MPTNILMPALSPTMEKGNLAKWLKKEGDKVSPGDVLAEIETDKATMEVEAIDEGVLAKIVVPEGTSDVPVNDIIAVLAGEGEDPKAAGAAEPKAEKKETAQPVRSESEAKRAPEQTGGEGGPVAADAEPDAGKPGVAKSGVATSDTRQADDKQPASKAPVEQAAKSNGHDADASQSGRVFSSPLARRLAQEAGVDLARVEGSGPHGRVVARDIAEAKSGKGLRPAGKPAQAERERAEGKQPVTQAPAVAPSLSDEKIRALFPEGSYEVIPHDNMRRVIAQRLTASMQTIPHFYLTVDCNIDRLMAAREEINASAPKDKDGKPAYKLSVNDFVVKALAVALQRIPNANVSWTESGMLRHKHSDVGVAVAMPGGLITPIVRNADQKTLSVISNEMKDFAVRARARKLKPEEYQGGTTAVSNLGMYGMKHFTAVINPPHATILAVGAGEQRPVVRDGKIEAATLMAVTLSCDHRAVDGALGAELLGAFKTLIENPVMMMV